MKGDCLLIHVMFDIDGTLVESCEFDAACFSAAVYEVTGINLDADWSKYKHVTDIGILNEIIFENDLAERQQGICREIKSVFIKKIKRHIQSESISEVPGAGSFLNLLRSMQDVTISLATGGWYESAVLKLDAAGIDFADLCITSSNDHFSRIEIMKISIAKVANGSDVATTYFGDGGWDKEACEALGLNFVVVGSKVVHDQKIEDFQAVSEAMAYIR